MTNKTSVYDNTLSACGSFGGAEVFDKPIRECKHDIANDHRLEFYDQIIQGEVDGKIKRCWFHMSKSHPCGKKDCHHPLHSPMPLMPYKIDYIPLDSSSPNSL